MTFRRFLSALQRRARHAALAAFAPTRLHVYDRPAYDHHQLSYSQEGEDLILARMFEHAPPGVFVDVGAHHPQRFSNTYRLYLDGWSGLNIDAMPGSMAAFNALRPRDANVESGVAEHEGALRFFCFNEPALNTFDEALARERDGKTGYRIVSEHVVRTERLATLIERHLGRDCRIQLLSVDVEGLDVSVLRSNDWTRFRPMVVAVEASGFPDCEGAARAPTAHFLQSLGYRLFAKTANTWIFVERDSVFGS